MLYVIVTERVPITNQKHSLHTPRTHQSDVVHVDMPKLAQVVKTQRENREDQPKP